jgi:hypothetical protein
MVFANSICYDFFNVKKGQVKTRRVTSATRPSPDRHAASDSLFAPRAAASLHNNIWRPR